VAEVTQVEVKMLSPGDDARPPVGALDISKTYTATFKTDKGEFQILLFDDEAPLTVENFINLATIGFYEGTMFHRVIPDFMAQGGDPLGTGTGGPGYQFQDEFHASRQHDKPGVLSMANSGPGTNGSQFFITFAPTPHLDGMHSVFGEVVEGLHDALNITTRDPATAQTRGDVITKIIISES
jgi:cyclophilin family peptidyl-prolyl cis-trans isomerase